MATMNRTCVSFSKVQYRLLALCFAALASYCRRYELEYGNQNIQRVAVTNVIKKRINAQLSSKSKKKPLFVASRIKVGQVRVIKYR